MKKSGKILTGLALIASLAGGLKGQEYIVNPFIQSNKSDLNWYGSGDINNDNTINWNDISRLDSIIDESYVPNLESLNPSEYRTLDRADINGDEIVNLEDKQMLENKLNGIISHLPGEWNKLETKEERESWLQKMLAIDKTDTLPGIPGEFVCGDFARQTRLNFQGSPELGYDFSEGLKDNGRFNIPLYYVTIAIPNSSNHAINTTITGDNLEDFLDGYYLEPQNDQKVVPGMWDMPSNCEVIINYTYVNHSQAQGDYLASTPILTFQITDENPELIWENDDPNLKIIKQRETQPPEINRFSPLENEVYDTNTVPLEYSINELNFKSAKYSLDNGETWNSLNQSGTKNLELQNGDYKLLIEAEDYFNLKSRDSANFAVNYIEPPPVGLEKVVKQPANFEAYPNPTTNDLNVKYNSDGFKKVYTEMYSIDGKLVYHNINEVSQGENLFKIDMSDKAKGVYLINVTSNGETVTKKIIKK